MSECLSSIYQFCEILIKYNAMKYNANEQNRVSERRQKKKKTQYKTESSDFHLINYLYIIHLSCIFCAFTVECKYILRTLLDTVEKERKKKRQAKQTSICVLSEFKTNNCMSNMIFFFISCPLKLLFYTKFCCVYFYFFLGCFHSNG